MTTILPDGREIIIEDSERQPCETKQEKNNKTFSVFMRQYKSGFLKIDALGRIFRVKKRVGGRAGNIITIAPTRAEKELPNGYLQLQMYEGGKRYIISAHIVNYILNSGRIPRGCIIHHKNWDKTDNRIQNLELMSHRQHNILHLKYRVSRKKQVRVKSTPSTTRGCLYGREKPVWQRGLTTQDPRVKEWHSNTIVSRHANYLSRISYTCKLLNSGLKQREVAALLGVSRRTVCQHIYDYQKEVMRNARDRNN